MRKRVTFDYPRFAGALRWWFMQRLMLGVLATGLMIIIGSLAGLSFWWMLPVAGLASWGYNRLLRRYHAQQQAYQVLVELLQTPPRRRARRRLLCAHCRRCPQRRAASQPGDRPAIIQRDARRWRPSSVGALALTV